METHSPFRESNQELKLLKSAVYEHPSLPGKVVHENSELNYYFEGSDLVKKQVEVLNETKKLYDELSEKYHIKHAGYVPLIGKSPLDGKHVAMVISDKIDGQGYKTDYDTMDVNARRESLKPQPEHNTAAKELLNKLTNYFVDINHTDGHLLEDIFSLDQYIFTDPNNKNPDGEFVLVDLDPPHTLVDNEEATHESSLHFAESRLKDMALNTLDPIEFDQWQAGLSDRLATPEAA